MTPIRHSGRMKMGIPVQRLCVPSNIHFDDQFECLFKDVMSSKQSVALAFTPDLTLCPIHSCLILLMYINRDVV